MACNTCKERAAIRAELSGKFGSDINQLIKQIKESRRINKDIGTNNGKKEIKR